MRRKAQAGCNGVCRPAPATPLASNLIYFSFATLTTTGYGDIFSGSPDRAQPVQSGIDLPTLSGDAAGTAGDAGDCGG
jgi:hypothetical protein